MSRWLVVTMTAIAGCGRLSFESVDGGVATDADDHRPSTCTVLGETGFSVLPPPGWGATGTVDVVPDVTAPHGIVARWTYPVGYVGGGAPGQIYFSPPAIGDPSLRELYIGVWWKVSNPWQGHPTSMNSLIYITHHDGAARINSTMSLVGTAPPYHVKVDNGGNPLGANVDDVVFGLDEWHFVEAHRRAATATGSFDGLVEWWLDGTLVARHTDVDQPQSEFEAVSLEPIWGGINGLKTETDYYWVDHIVVCLL